MTDKEHGTIWVCVCCMLVHANGHKCATDCGDDPWSLWADNSLYTLTMGLFREDHEEGCDPDDAECECDRQTFSWSSCDGCGSNLGGERHAFTWHREKPSRAVHDRYLTTSREAWEAGRRSLAYESLRLAALVRRDMAARSEGVRRFEDKRNRIVTPYTAPNRFTDEEKALFDAGECSWQTACGMPYTEYCGEPSKKGASFGYCAEHEAELLREYFPDGSPRRNHLIGGWQLLVQPHRF